VSSVTERCGCQSDGVLLFSCSGGSNVGQLANEAAKALTQLGQGRMSCVVGLAAHLPDFDEKAEFSETIVAIDGCETACARKAVEHLEHRVDVHVIVTELGIEKNHRFDLTREQIAAVAGAVADRLNALSGRVGCCADTEERR
jgi:uncharacterized metal-binding protein